MPDDKDFGGLVNVSGTNSAGDILIRFPGNARGELAETITRLATERGEELAGAFVLVQPGQIRIGGRIPP